jgi:microcystin degradation protein MlrC
MKLFSAGIVTETNTFSPMLTGLADFNVIQPSDVTEGSDVGIYKSSIDVFRKKAEERGWEFTFGLFAIAEPAGRTTRRAYETLRDELLERLRNTLPVDAVLLFLHGSMVADGYDDCESDIIERVREIVGPTTRIGVELDLHCDVTNSMIENADALVLFKEYPHTDVQARAEDLFVIIADTVEGKVNPTMALFDCRMIGTYFTTSEPMRSFVNDMLALEGENGVLSVSLVHCFPWCDVATSGTQVLVITDNDKALAGKIASELGQKFFSLRNKLQPEMLSMDEALDKALSAKSKPVVIADRSDNAGGGAPSDSTFVLKELLDRGVENAGIAMIWDPLAVKMAISAGKGAHLNLRLGGKVGPMSGNPLDLRVTVNGIILDMIQDWPQEGEAIRSPCGDAVALHCEGIDIIVNTLRRQVLSPQVFSNFGIDPLKKDLLIVKSAQHFYAAFRSIASDIIYMAAPGATAPFIKKIPYEKVDLRKYPWIDDPFKF